MDAINLVLEAGHGEVVVKVADHNVVSIKQEATRMLTKQDRR